ncbi:MAG: aminopeptidase [Thermoplasmata archaeon]
MDDRIKKHAQILCDWSTDIKEGDKVIIRAHPSAYELVLALYKELGARKAKPVTIMNSNETNRTYMLEHGEGFETPEHLVSLVEASDAFISIIGDDNLSSMAEVPGDILSSFARANQPLMNLLANMRVCLTQFPTPSQAQFAGMSLEDYKNFVYNSIIRDWQEVHDMQELLREKLSDTDEVCIEGPDTELYLSVKGMNPVNSDGKRNLPSGEVYVAPIPESTEGKVYFDLPVVQSGREIHGVRLEFEGGEVVDHSSETHEELLTSILDTDEGSRRLGELGIGTNRDINRFTRNMLFDEKMGDTIHLALGYAVPISVGEGLEGNVSAVHIDIIKNMKEGKMAFDGDTVMEEGTFFWEKKA